MEQYFCSCLNIVINVRSHRECLGNDMLTFGYVDGQNIDGFFAQNLLDVALGISGIELAQEALVKTRQYDDWIVSSCLNCGMDAFCLHASKGIERVLLSTNMQFDKKAYESIKSSSQYSDMFKLNLDVHEGNRGIHLSAKDVSDISTKLTKLTEKILKVEEEAMMERIRLFKETQELQYRELKVKTNQQKEILLRSIRKQESNQMDSLFDSFNESYFGDSTQNEERDASTDLPLIKGRPIPAKGSLRSNIESSNTSSAHSLPISALSSTNKTRNRYSRRKVNFQPSRHRSFSESDDTLFDLEGFHEDKHCEPFYESDDDSSGDATSLESSGGYSIPTNRGLNPGDRVYATSVPVSIPLFENTRNSYDLESDDEELKSPSPNHIADSIKALAKSMQDSTGMFGELPRPRVNTMR